MSKTTLSAALEARDKQLNVDVYPYLPYDEKEAIKDAIDESRERSLDWIAKALPFLRLSKHVHIPETRPELIDDPWDDALTALIAQAEGQKEGENG